MSEQGDVAMLSEVERQAVELGVLDADRGWFVPGHEDGLGARLARLSRTISGQRGRQPLANARLELVREFAFWTHRRHRPAEQLIPALVRQGYRPDQIGTFAALAA